jgi:uncharacterized protein (TIGR00290 family)
VKRVALSWSSGKDSAWALHVLKQSPGIEVVALITSFNCGAGRVAMHAVRRTLVEAQAQRVGLPLWPVELPWPCSNAAYEGLMSAIWRHAIVRGVTAVAFGDLFLQDIRQYREHQLRGIGLEPLFPIWNLPTTHLAHKMIRGGVKAKITCLDPKRLDRTYAGQNFDAGFVAGLPASVDPCGENGEFHTFAFDAPVFSSAIQVENGEIIERDGFVFADLL